MQVEPANSSSSPSSKQGSSFPPGWVGIIARFFYDHAPYPNEKVAVAGALALMSALCGRFINVSGTGLNIWIAIVGGTGIGKEVAASGISKLVSSAAKSTPCIYEFIGPSSVASQEAAHKRLAKTPSSLLFIGELGIKLKIWCAPNANATYAGLVAFLLDVFGKSGRGNRLGARENSDRDKGAAAVESPNLAALGDTTESTLLEALTEPNFANGFIPRWDFVFAGDQRGPANKRRQPIPPDELIQYIANLASTSLTCQQTGNVYDIPLSAEAQAIDDEIEAFTSAKINNSQAEITRHLYSRARLNILKIAALLAYGERHEAFEVNAEHILWAKRFVLDGIERLLSKVENGEIGEVAGDETKQLNAVINATRDYFKTPFDPASNPYGIIPEMRAYGVITESYLSRRLLQTAAFKHPRGGNRALKDAIKALLDADDISEMPAHQTKELFGRKPRGFVVSNPARFEKSCDGV